MKSLKYNLVLANHIKSVSFWNKVDWSLSNNQIANLYGIAYTTVCINRKKYAKHTVKPRVNWRNKVLNIMVGKANHVHAKTFVEAVACYTAGRHLGIRMKYKTVANGIYMKIG